jgi:hypothetical protein
VKPSAAAASTSATIESAVGPALLDDLPELDELDDEPDDDGAGDTVAAACAVAGSCRTGAGSSGWALEPGAAVSIHFTTEPSA